VSEEWARRAGRRAELLEQAAEVSRAELLGESIATPADAVRALPDYLEGGDGTPARQAAAHAAALANAVLEETSHLSALNIVGQVRMTAVDLLRASGFDRLRAQEVVRTADAERLER
jgi:hypothetical protein